MPEKLFQFNDLEIWKRGGRYFVRYGAGSHQVVMREDEITEQEATFAARGNAQATEMLFALQKRLIAQGVDPYKSNVISQMRAS